ncbi:hypothetical protein [Klebsiella pneumoniae]|uniref:hypothetical protein n=1 Tax=Klebsiella pneumoniae TaxID=573 RepID=UPI00191A1DB5|nr:hypothetical protein [Klebsiella pneumoniae]CAA0342656.1 Uncharacterised protein [Klebsiella pneumoniae]HCI6506788.1 hypothetical protein [Klebsiella quasipneumoniae subsp. quasipneumoniae]
MTKSTITRERLEQLADNNTICKVSWDERIELAQIALAAMDSEPVIADCDPEVYEKGVSACLVVIPKETAEVICKGISAATGCKVDWHYIGGRVHIKALQAAPQPAPVATSEEHRQLRDLVMMVKMLCRTVRKYNPESQQAANFTAYLQKEGLISAADCLRETDPLDTESEDRRG